MIIVLKSTKTWTFSWKSCMSFSSKQPKHKHFYEKVTWNYHQINKIMNFFMKKLHDNCPQINKIMNFFMKKFHDIVLKSTKTWTFYEKSCMILSSNWIQNVLPERMILFLRLVLIGKFAKFKLDFVWQIGFRMLLSSNWILRHTRRARNNFIIDFLRKNHMILPSNRPKRKQFRENFIW